MNRPNWDDYFMQITELVKTRSTCLRRQVGAVLVVDNRIIATGYNGAPNNCSHCEDIGCVREQQNIPSGKRVELCRAVHGEENALIQAAYSGVSTKNATMYVTTQPCIFCAKSMINAGIRRIVYKGDYPDKLSLDMLKETDIVVQKYEPPDI